MLGRLYGGLLDVPDLLVGGACRLECFLSLDYRRRPLRLRPALVKVRVRVRGRVRVRVRVGVGVGVD